MFERFTDRARRVVVQAQAEAKALDHNYIGSEHLLLAVTHESIGGLAAKVLDSLGIGRDTVRQRVEEAVERGSQSPSGHIPFTPEAKKALESSLREAVALGHQYIGTEHLLIGLMRNGDSVAGRVLADLGADLGEARKEVLRLLDEYRRGQENQAP
jgi:ATP-dependent Clp protease ATP-binding subunit ClpC